MTPPSPDDAPLSDISLWQAAAKGDAQEVARLIPLIDPKILDNMALKAAVIGEHLECVKLLIPFSDVDSGGNIPLLLSLRHGNQELFDLLYPGSDPNEVQYEINQNNHHSEKMRQFIAQYENNLINNIINNNLPGGGASRPSKKM